MTHADGLPEDLTTALAARQATITERSQEGARVYLRADSPASGLFVHYSSDPRDVAVLAHEARVRELVGDRGALRAPPVLEASLNWLLEVEVELDHPCVPQAVELIVAAASELAQLELPDGPTGPPRGRRARLRSRVAWLRSKVPVRDLLRARALVRESQLPLVASHGDFFPDNVLLGGGACWVVDWELTGRRPLGYDLMQYWTGAGDEERDLLFERAIELAGSSMRGELLRLRYAVAVQCTVSMLAAEQEFDRDVAAGEALLSHLPELRREAGF